MDTCFYIFNMYMSWLPELQRVWSMNNIVEILLALFYMHLAMIISFKKL